MNATPELGKRVFVEIQITGGQLDLRKSEWAYMKVWNENEFVDLLRDRTGKSELEVRSLLQSLASTLAHR